MITYLTILMTISGVVGFRLCFDEDDKALREAGALALKIASALLAAIVTLGVKGS